MRSKPPRSGFTLLELLVVMAFIILLATAAMPSLFGLKRNAEQKATADRVRGLIADARGLAITDGVPYRLAITSSGDRIRMAAEGPDFATQAAADASNAATKTVEYKLEKTNITVAADSDSGEAAPIAGSDGWITLGTFLPNGTCRADGGIDTTMIEVNETGYPPMQIRLRGITGTARLLPPPGDGSGNGGKP